MTFSFAVPAFPVVDVAATAAFYEQRMGFTIGYIEDGFCRLLRDVVELQLWASTDESWRTRVSLVDDPVHSGAESFIAGTASCRIQVDQIDELHAEMSASEVLHPTDAGTPTSTDWGTREFAVLDLDGNLITFYQPV